MRRSFLFLAALLLVTGTAAAQDDRPFVRHPAVSPDGSQIAFSHQGDLWTVDAGGGRPYRLTVHEAYEGFPRWSPDGTQIAFVSDRFGNDDLYVMAAEGGTPRRLTYHSAGDTPGGWTTDGGLLFNTRRTYRQVEWEPEIYHVASEGGTPDRLLDALGSSPTMSPDGRFVAFERGAARTSRKHYTGPADRDLWLYDTETEGYVELTEADGNDHQPVWIGARELLFVSERDGTYNLYRLRLADGGQPQSQAEAITSFDADGVRAFAASADGQVVAIERRTDLYVLRGLSGEPRLLELRVPGDDRFDAVEYETFTDEATAYAVSPNGEQIAFVVRGELFLMENDPESSRTVRLTQHPYRDRDVAWLTDSTLVFTSDRHGQYDLFRLESADAEQTNLLRTLKHRTVRLTDTDADERQPQVAPGGRKIAFQRGRGQLVVAGLSGEGTLSSERVLREGWASADDVAWSPDSRWLAYAMDDLTFNQEVYVQRADGSGEPVNVTQHPEGDGQPVWSRDGTKLGFVSDRSNDADVWFVWLRQEDWERTKQDWEAMDDEEEEEKGEDEGEEDEDSTEVEPIEIDLERIHERLEQVTALPGNEGSLVISEDGETFCFTAGRGGRTANVRGDVDLYSIQWDGSEQKRLTEGDTSPYAVRLGPGGEHLFAMRSGGKIARIDPSSGDVEGLGFSARMAVDHAAEREQVFEEAWRVLDRGFYDPGFHGVDWQAMRAKYRPWALKASTNRDFRAIFNEMLGELNASHMGLYGSDRAETQEVRTGLLGVEIDPVADGVRVERVVPRSPAARSQSRLQAGDVIVAVDGVRVTDAPNFYALLGDTVDERVLLVVRDTDGDEREVVIRPTRSLSDELYHEWVAERRRLTEEYSDGRLGYIHVEGMNWPSFERFERELVASGEGKEGLVVDVRYNGGGWTTDYLMAVLTVRRHAYTVPRGAAADLEREHTDFRPYYPFGERLPLPTWTGPVAALCNEFSYSNAEIFSHAFKNLDLGPLVGMPTWGAVISTGGERLLDGSFVRMPFRGWYVYADDQNMENGPAVPDVIVDNAPDARATGNDEQLRTAVRTLLGEIDAAADRGRELPGTGR